MGSKRSRGIKKDQRDEGHCCPMTSRSHQSLRYTRWQLGRQCRLHALGDFLMARTQRHASSRQEAQPPLPLSSTTASSVGRRQQGTSQAASRQLRPRVTRSLQLVGHLDSSYRGLSRSERCGAWPCVRCLHPLAGGGSAEKRLRGCNYSVIVITV